jgi:hypothetical protein
MSENIIATIPKNSREHIRVGLGSFKGHELFSVRVWIEKEDGTALPTQKGLTAGVVLLPSIIEALQATLAHARKIGVLPDGG